MQQHHRLRQPGPVLADHQRVRTELLAEGHRHGVLELRAAHLEHVVELVGLGRERRLEHLHGVEQRVRRQDQRDLDRRRVDVVGRLAEVDVLVGVEHLVVALLVAHQLERTVGDDLVGVHVGRRAGAALHDVDDEVIVQRPGPDLLAGAADRLVPLVIEQAEVVVGGCGRLLDRGERLDEVRAHPDLDARDREVLQRPQGVYTPVDVGGDLAITDQIVLGSRGNRHVEPPVREARRWAPPADPRTPEGHPSERHHCTREYSLTPLAQADRAEPPRSAQAYPSPLGRLRRYCVLTLGAHSASSCAVSCAAVLDVDQGGTDV